MSVIYLVRHGQASFGAADYDELSDTGHEQARLAGLSLTQRGATPQLLVRGDLLRHKETAAAAADAAGWGAEVLVDRGWDEFDHLDVLSVVDPRYGRHGELTAAVTGDNDPQKAFQAVFETAVEEWVRGTASYTESFQAFGERVAAAFARLVDRLGPRDTAVVFSSSGPIALVAATALSLEPPAFARLNRVSVNGAITKVLWGARGLSLLTFNGHAHVEQAGLITYR
jgi:broad specificity phosphatase PhoE